MKEKKINRILFLLGAGASVPMGIPAMRQFSRDFVDYGEKQENRETIGYWLRGLKRATGTGAWDLERLLSIIRQSKNIDNDVAMGLVRKKYFKTESRNRRRFDNLISTIHKDFETIEYKLLEYIRVKCLSPEMEKARRIYSKILPLSKRYTLELFTTNYDPILENVCAELEYGYSDGFFPDKKSGVFKWDKKYLSNEKINIYKIHGSVTWYKKDNYILKFPADISRVPGINTLMIYPTELKEILNPPFSYINRTLEKILFDSNLCIVVGHSFRDDYIKNLFLDRLKEKNIKIYFVCGKRTRSIKKRIFGSTNMVTPIIENFGEVDIVELIKKYL